MRGDLEIGAEIFSHTQKANSQLGFKKKIWRLSESHRLAEKAKVRRLGKPHWLLPNRNTAHLGQAKFAPASCHFGWIQATRKCRRSTLKHALNCLESEAVHFFARDIPGTMSSENSDRLPTEYIIGHAEYICFKRSPS
jgi:hypothetical protein